MIENIKKIAKEELLEKVKELIVERARFNSIVCEKGPDGFRLIYFFEKDFDLLGFEITIKKDEKLSSISHFVEAARLSESEIKEKYGL